MSGPLRLTVRILEAATTGWVRSIAWFK
jgi:hypothetical protein